MDYMDIRKLTIQAIYLDDELSDILVLKGGNALSILELTRRSSYDLDFSLYECAYTSEELEERFKNAICSHFEENDFNIISFKFNVKPKIQRPGNDPKWGGYSLEFKFIKKERYDFLTKNTRPISINSAYSQEYVNMTGTNDPVLIELSRNEYCNGYNEKIFEGITIKIYSPWMIIFEKLRAICQQMEEYRERTNKASRARDFFDIYTTNNCYVLSKTQDDEIPQLKELCENIFSIKKVDMDLLTNLKNYREFHKQSFQKVIDSVHIDERTDLKEFDFYFDETVNVADWVLNNLR